MNNTWVQKIYTTEGTTNEDILAGKKALDVGCGLRKLKGSIGIDRINDEMVDIVHDLDELPWPFKENTFDLVFVNSVLEHIKDVQGVLREIHRILKKDGRVVIKVPYFRSVDAFTDPTHFHFFASSSLDFYIPGTEFSRYKYDNFSFKKIGFWYGWPHPSRNFFKNLLKKIIHNNPNFYDQYFSLLFPVECVFWELEAIKK